MGAGTSAGFSAKWQGFLRIDHPTEYQFTLVSNDVTWLSLDGCLRVNNGAYGSSRQTASVPLEAGLHAVDLAFFSRGEDFQPELLWAEGPGPATPISPDHLFPTRTAWRAYDALWGQAYLWPLTGSLGIFAALWWWPLGQVRRHCRERADDAATNRVLVATTGHQLPVERGRDRLGAATSGHLGSGRGPSHRCDGSGGQALLKRLAPHIRAHAAVSAGHRLCSVASGNCVLNE